ncbi:30S ribosomal protein S21, chloroplastic-like isoform X2 [Prosopis cineraria]|uniref:30S ribosomal protein S21, chloroplastic-like isoform X2 n=1 Tax=Prosopis cineraria TaxID=364024 RepID=UPI00240F98F0|nr:30S ribosomal protein S21, chloroplastic-like isoform X2 [Prosopis cineraria]
MAVSFLSNFFPTLLPSNSPWPRPTCFHCFPSQLRLSQSSSGWSSMVTANDLPESSPSFSSLHVIVGDNEPEDRLLSRFRKEVLKAGVLQECKRRRFFESQQDKRKRKSREAAKKNRRRRPQSRAPAQNKDQAPKKRKGDDEKDDNWELPEVDLPYC